MLGGGAAGVVGDADCRAQHAMRCAGWAGGCAGGHLGQLHGVCGRLSWPGGGGEENLCSWEIFIVWTD